MKEFTHLPVKESDSKDALWFRQPPVSMPQRNVTA